MSTLFEALAGRARKDRQFLQLQEEARQADAENIQTIEHKDKPLDAIRADLELKRDD